MTWDAAKSALTRAATDARVRLTSIGSTIGQKLSSSWSGHKIAGTPAGSTTVVTDTRRLSGDSFKPAASRPQVGSEAVATQQADATNTPQKHVGLIGRLRDLKNSGDWKSLDALRKCSRVFQTILNRIPRNDPEQMGAALDFRDEPFVDPYTKNRLSGKVFNPSRPNSESWEEEPYRHSSIGHTPQQLTHANSVGVFNPLEIGKELPGEAAPKNGDASSPVVELVVSGEYCTPESVNGFLESAARLKNPVIENKLGLGFFGVTYKCTVDGKEGVLKVPKTYDPSAPRMPKADLEEWNHEVALMQKAKGVPGAVQLMGVCTRKVNVGGEEATIYLPITEYCNGGEYDYNKKLNPPLTPADEIRLLKDVAKTMQELSTLRIRHRDLAARNLLMHHDGTQWTAKVADFGLARLNDGTAAPKPGPVRHMAPEALERCEYSEKTDVWSFGVLMYEVICKTIPYSGQEKLAAAASVARGEAYPNLQGGLESSKYARVRHIFEGITPRLFSLESTDRATFKDLVTLLERADKMFSVTLPIESVSLEELKTVEEMEDAFALVQSNLKAQERQIDALSEKKFESEREKISEKYDLKLVGLTEDSEAFKAIEEEYNHECASLETKYRQETDKLKAEKRDAALKQVEALGQKVGLLDATGFSGAQMAARDRLQAKIEEELSPKELAEAEKI